MSNLLVNLIITQLLLLVVIVMGVWHFVRLNRIVQSLWDMVKDLQRERRIH